MKGGDEVEKEELVEYEVNDKNEDEEGEDETDNTQTLNSPKRPEPDHSSIQTTPIRNTSNLGQGRNRRQQHGWMTM